ncbi:hypothetical protein GDO81_001105 [Engystomops pustulosus]|uniref:Uncharacterized protein n=1 Tax=Engystomops pustulosus TaxID=76066 RepID=A0AAV7DB32_ENGPU|nr:hypothetical protein GDO81_001105 [Engystomops pustulosus]
MHPRWSFKLTTLPEVTSGAPLLGRSRSLSRHTANVQVLFRIETELSVTWKGKEGDYYAYCCLDRMGKRTVLTPDKCSARWK